MNTQSKTSPPLRQIPLAVPIGLCSIILLSVVAWAVYLETYDIAIGELRQHEVVDLAGAPTVVDDGRHVLLRWLERPVRLRRQGDRRGDGGAAPTQHRDEPSHGVPL